MLGKDDFLKLLVSQLQHQDPMNPVDDKDFMGQMAQFTSVEQLTNMATAIDRMSTASQSTQSIALIGKTVSWKKEDGTTRRRCRHVGVVQRRRHQHHRGHRPDRAERDRVGEMSLDGVNGLDPARRAAAAAAAAAEEGRRRCVVRRRPQTRSSGPLKLSSHAQQRIQRREIAYDEPVAARLEAAVNQAAAKGSRDSLVLVDSTAFVVSVRNRTVITAVPVSPKNDQVFTNVDSAVIG